ncbi:unnamed protein product [Brassica oleracea var. botrytis]
MYMLMSMTPQGADSRPFLSPNFSPFVQVPTCYRPLEPNVPQDYRRTFSYHNNIYQYPHWPQVTGLNQHPTRSRRRSGNLFSSCRNSALSTVIANLFSSDFDQYPTIDPTSMHDDIVSTSHAAEAKDRTSFTSLDSVDRYSTTTSMHNHRVLASHDAETEEITNLLEKLELERRR